MTAPDATCDVLVLAAHPLELEGFLPRLGPELCGLVQRRQVSCKSVGVGLVAAASGTASLLAMHRPRAAVLVGSYGLFPDRDGELLELAVVSHVRLVDSEVLAGRAAIPDPMPTQETLHFPLCAGLASTCDCVREVTMATTLAITTDDELAMRLARVPDCRGENLELFAVAHACRVSGVPLAALLGATNWVGTQGRLQWRQHHAEVARTTAKAVLHWLDDGAPGL